MSRYDWGKSHPGIDFLEHAVESTRERVVMHPLYGNLNTHQAIVTSWSITCSQYGISCLCSSHCSAI